MFYVYSFKTKKFILTVKTNLEYFDGPVFYICYYRFSFVDYSIGTYYILIYYTLKHEYNIIVYYLTGIYLNLF